MKNQRILGFRREVDKNRAFLTFYSASSVKFLPKFREDLSVPFSGVKNPDSWPPEDVIDRSSRNVGKNLPVLAA
jgi:hypothetical protein